MAPTTRLMSLRSQNECVSISDLTSTDGSPNTRQHSLSPSPLPPRNSRSVTQSLTGFPGNTSKVQRLCQHLRHISCTDSESDDNITKEGLKSPIGTIPHAVQPELGVPESSEPSVAILDPGGLWPHLEPSIKAHMPLKSLELVSPITKSNVIINELPIKLSVYESIESLQKTWKEASIKVWNWYKAPFAVIYVVAADNQDYYRNHVRPKIRQFLDLQDSESLMKEGWLIMYVNVTSGQAPTPEKGIDTVHSKIFGLLSANFYVKSPGDKSCFVSVCKDGSEEEKQRHLEDYNLNKHWNSIAMQIGTVIVDTFNARVQMYETNLSLLEEKCTDPGWDFSQFFLVNDALALMYRQLGLINDALLKYQELAASVIMLSNEAQKTMEQQKVEEDPEFGRLLFGLPSQCMPQPHPVFDLHSMAFRKRLLSRTLHSAVLEAQLYLFAREIQLLLETCSPIEMVGCACSFIPAYYHQLLLRTDIVPAHAELWALKASWDIVKLYSAMYQCCHKQLSQPPPSNSTETEYSEKGGGGGVYETVIKDKNTSAEICDLLFFMLDRLMGCVSQSSSFDCLLESPVWEIYTCGFWINAQTWTPAFEQLQLEPILSPSLNAQPPSTIISEKLLFWDSDEGGEVEQLNFTEIEKSEVLPNPMRILSSFPMTILQSSNIFHNSERRELHNHLLEIYSSKDGKKMSTSTSMDFGSFDSSPETSFQDPTDDDSENMDGQQKSHCKGLETANDLDLVYLQITYSLVKYLMKAKKLRTAALIQQCRCDVLLSHGKWSAVVSLLEGYAYPQDIGWHLLEFCKLQRLAQCHWNMGLIDSFIGTVLNMCCAYKGAITTTTTMELAPSSWLNKSSMITLKGLLTGYIETCSSVLLTTSVRLNPSETNLTCIATPELLFDGGNCGMDDDVLAGDEFVITCNVLSHLPCQIKICPLPVLTLKVLDMSSSSSSKRGGGMEEGGTGTAAMCVGEYIVQHEHSSKDELFLIPGINCWEFKVHPVKEGVLVGHNLTVNWGGSINLNHSFLIPQNISEKTTTIINSNIRSCHHRHDKCPGQGQRQFLNVKPFIPKSTLELLVPPFLPYEETSSVFIQIFSNEDSLTDVLLNFPFSQNGKFLNWEAWLDGGGTTTKKLLPISSHEIQIGDNNDEHHHHIDEGEKKEEDIYVKAIRFEKPIPPESVVMLKLQLVIVAAINRTVTTKTGNNDLNSMASIIIHRLMFKIFFLPHISY